jgi:hypothetical protein
MDQRKEQQVHIIPVVLRVTSFVPAGGTEGCCVVATTASFPTCGRTTDVSGHP